MQIGAPTNVVHVSHMGYTPEGGFSFDENPLPVEWKKLFRAVLSLGTNPDRFTASRARFTESFVTCGLFNFLFFNLIIVIFFD